MHSTVRVRERPARGAVILTFVLALLSSGRNGYTANLGGKISHPELRTGMVSAGDGGSATDSAGATDAQDQ